jgi:hypothetical protein
MVEVNVEHRKQRAVGLGEALDLLLDDQVAGQAAERVEGRLELGAADVGARPGDQFGEV